ncbi:hypothetical protein EZV62_001142 [Acer yangbiense]|uniref:Rieske domain-containing protein n=1 Tax=Acer yangbiense TaxID=1000413 RepID=A0A5C7IT21_9ROSI|nr:hypothetical protein EZV62_001142 [Acer yangbiense]
MKALIPSSVPSLSNIPKALHNSTFSKPKLMNLQSSPIPSWSLSSTYHKNTLTPFKVFTISSPSSSTVSTENTPSPPELEDEKFDWFSEWYPVMPVSDLDKRVPHGKKVLGIDVVVWWDKNESSWNVFEDVCPHRLAPLFDGRIDRLGRLQCAYHGWCFNGSGHCKLIPQAAADGPPVHTLKKACVGVYPSIVHHDMVWFWPNTDPEYEDIITKKKPAFIPELDDPSFSKVFLSRDIPCGYEILIENIMDPAHVPYSHYGIFQIDEPPEVKVDREGGKPLEISVNQLDINGFLGNHERKIVEAGSANWLKTCFVPTKSDAFVVGFRRWLKKYSGGQIDWGGKFSTGTLPLTPPREQLMDR